MFSILFFFTALLFCLLGYLKTRAIINPLSLYLVFWTFWLIFSVFNPFNLFEVSDKAYFLLWLNIVAFGFGFVIIANKREQFKFSFHFSKSITSFFLVFNILISIVLLYYFQRYRYFLAILPIAESRNIVFQQGYLIRSYTEFIFFNYIITSFLFFSITIGVVDYISKYKLTLLGFMTIVNVIIFTGIGFGRVTIFIFVLLLLISMSLKPKSRRNIQYNENKKKAKIKLIIKAILFISLGVIGMVFTTGFRLGYTAPSFNEFLKLTIFSFEQGSVYFLGPFRALDYFLKGNYVSRLGYTFGRSTFGGLEEIINNIAILYGVNIITANQIMTTFSVDPIIIGTDGQMFNAFFTGISNFYLDGGVILVALFPFILGCIIALVWNFSNRKNELFIFCLLIYLVKISITYQYKWDLTTPSEWIVILLLTIFSLFPKTTILEGNVIE